MTTDELALIRRHDAETPVTVRKNLSRYVTFKVLKVHGEMAIYERRALLEYIDELTRDKR